MVSLAAIPFRFFFSPRVVRGNLGEQVTRTPSRLVVSPPWAGGRFSACVSLFHLIPHSLRRHCCCRPWNAVATVWTTLILLPRHQPCMLHAACQGLWSTDTCVAGYSTKYRFILSYVCRCVARASDTWVGAGRVGAEIKALRLHCGTGWKVTKG